MTRTYPMSSQAVHLNSYDACVSAKRAGQKIIGYLKKKNDTFSGKQCT